MNPKKSQQLDLQRKKPKQRRSEETISSIFEATAQVLQHHGTEQLTTNHIAERSGFSIGALYQYFPNKNAILLAMAKHEREKIVRNIKELIVTGAHLSLEDLLRGIVRMCLGAFSRRIIVRKVLMNAVLSNTEATKHFIDELNKTTQFIYEEIKNSKRTDIRPQSEISTYIMTRALLGVIRSAVFEHNDMLYNPIFEDELVRLLVAFLRVSP